MTAEPDVFLSGRIMDAGGWVAVLAVLSVVARVIWIASVVVVRHSEAVVLERFSKFHRILESGINFIVPFIDTGRQFTWTWVEISESGVPKMRTLAVSTPPISSWLLTS